MTRHSRTHFFKYCSANVAKLILARRKVRYSAPRIFNDPFDTQIDLRFPFTVDELQNLTLRRVIDATKGDVALPNFSHHQHVAILEELREMRTQVHLPDDAMIDLLKADIGDGIKSQIDDLPKLHAGLRDEFIDTAIVYCVSEVSDDLLMWSHYSENHTGVVIKFRVLQELDNALCAAIPITYQEEMPELASIEEWVDFMLGFRKLDAQKMWAKMFSTKHIGWQYEKEWRVIDHTKGPAPDHHDVSIYPEEIGEIIFGCRTREEDRAEILNLLKADFPHAKVTQAKKNSTLFKLNFEKMK